MDKPPFAQTFVGAVLAAALASLIVWFLTSRQPIRVEVTSASVVATPELRPREANTDVAMSNASGHRSDAEIVTKRTDTKERTDACAEAVIEDPDHYSNVRSGPGTNYEIITRVLENEVFCVTSKEGHWWTIRTAKGVAGYIYYDRVRVIAASKI